LAIWKPAILRQPFSVIDSEAVQGKEHCLNLSYMVAHSIRHNVGGVVTRLEPGVGFAKKPTVIACALSGDEKIYHNPI
jgi:hypothetical protein